MRKCKICGKEVNGANIVQIEEHKTIQVCDDCYSPDLGEIVNKIEEQEEQGGSILKSELLNTDKILAKKGDYQISLIEHSGIYFAIIIGGYSNIQIKLAQSITHKIKESLEGTIIKGLEKIVLNAIEWMKKYDEFIEKENDSYFEPMEKRRLEKQYKSDNKNQVM